MIVAPNLAPLLQRFFSDRLMRQKDASAHTISSYRDTFRLLLKFLEKRLRKPPSGLQFDDLQMPLIAEFLNDLETSRKISARSRNLRLTAIRSFFDMQPSNCRRMPPRSSACWLSQGSAIQRLWLIICPARRQKRCSMPRIWNLGPDGVTAH
jgi:hypothetical protein